MGLWDVKINAFSFKFTFYTASELEMGSLSDFWLSIPAATEPQH